MHSEVYHAFRPYAGGIGSSTLAVTPKGTKQFPGNLKYRFIFDEELQGLWRRFKAAFPARASRPSSSVHTGEGAVVVVSEHQSCLLSTATVCIHSISTVFSHTDFYAKRQGEGSGRPQQRMHIWMSKE